MKVQVDEKIQEKVEKQKLEPSIYRDSFHFHSSHSGCCYYGYCDGASQDHDSKNHVGRYRQKRDMDYVASELVNGPNTLNRLAMHLGSEIGVVSHDFAVEVMARQSHDDEVQKASRGRP